jgi:hypothetical protein
MLLQQMPINLFAVSLVFFINNIKRAICIAKSVIILLLFITHDRNYENDNFNTFVLLLLHVFNSIFDCPICFICFILTIMINFDVIQHRIC